MADLVEEKTHARLSPSGSKRWMTCPGSVRLTEQLNIPDKTSKFAAEGTVAHEIHELCLLKNQDAEAYIGQTLTADGFKFKVNQNMVDAVQSSLDYIRNRINDAEFEGMRVELRVEVRASLKYLGIDGLDGGTSDVVLLFWDTTEDDIEYLHSVEVVDYKHGAGVPVDAENNTQALCYALGVIMAPEMNGQRIPDGIRITISQPRAHHPDGRIRWWEVDTDYLLNWQDDELVPKANLVHSEDPEFKASDDGCRFCPCSGQCPALYEKTQQIAIADFKDDTYPEPVTMTIEQKTLVMQHASMLKSFITAVENQIKLEVDSGSADYEEHFKLVRSRSNRKLTEEAFDEDFSPLLDHVQVDELYTKKPLGISAIETLLTKSLGKTKGKGKLIKGIIDSITIKPEGKIVIAPMSDKRRAVQPSLTNDFVGLEDE